MRQRKELLGEAGRQALHRMDEPRHAAVCL